MEKSNNFFKLPISQKELSSFSNILFEFSSDSLIILDSVGQIAYVNNNLCNIIKQEQDKLIGKIPDFLFGGVSDSSFKTFINDLIKKGSWNGDVMCRSNQGSLIPMNLQFYAIYDSIGIANHYLGICTNLLPNNKNDLIDVNLDPLTNVLNFNALMLRLNHMVRQVEKNVSILSVIYINIDHFHDIASRNKYKDGDVILRNMANLLSENIDPSDTIARIKADIFCIVLQDIYTQEKIEEKINNLFNKITAPFAIHENIEKITVSIGVSIYPISATTPEELLETAKQASETAKNKGRNQICFHKKLTEMYN